MEGQQLNLNEQSDERLMAIAYQQGRQIKACNDAIAMIERVLEMRAAVQAAKDTQQAVQAAKDKPN